MTDAKQDELLGRLTREVKELERQAAGLEIELKRIGENFKQLGADLIANPECVDFDKTAVTKDTGNLFELIEKYRECGEEIGSKKAQLEKLLP